MNKTIESARRDFAVVVHNVGIEYSTAAENYLSSDTSDVSFLKFLSKISDELKRYDKALDSLQEVVGKKEDYE